MNVAQSIAADTRLPFRVDVEPPKMMTIKEEMAITRRALERNPGSFEFRLRMARFHYTLDQFDEAVDLLEELNREGDDFGAVHLLGGTLLARETHKDTLRAKEIHRADQAEIHAAEIDRVATLTSLLRVLFQVAVGEFRVKLRRLAVGNAVRVEIER